MPMTTRSIQSFRRRKENLRSILAMFVGGAAGALTVSLFTGVFSPLGFAIGMVGLGLVAVLMIAKENRIESREP